jgi:RHS repeat-associated protein
MTAIHRTIAVGLLLLVGGGAALAQRQPEPLAASKVRLLVVLRKPGARRDSPRIVKEPDFDKIGGNVISRHDGVIEIEIPLAAARHLVDDDNVAYIQRVWMGEPLDDWSAPAATATSSKLHARTLETGSNLSWASGAFLYDGSGNIKKIGDDDYVYDSALRLIQSVVHGTTETYKYDSFGNLKEKTLGGAAPGVIPVDPGSNRISGVSYDAIGDQLNDGSGGQARYVYDAMGMMTGVMGTTGSYERRMIYTADDERIGTAIDSNLIRWRFRDFNTNQVLREWSSSYNMSWDWVEDFVYADGKLVAGETVDYQGGRRHFSLDHLGNVRLITGQNGLAYGRHDYYPFGVEQTSSIQTYVNFNYSPPEPMKFAGHERDYLGVWDTENTDYIDDMHARYYNPNVARFLSVDPVLGDPHAPQSWNRYAYVHNNPVILTDPTGRCTFIPCMNYGRGAFDYAEEITVTAPFDPEPMTFQEKFVNEMDIQLGEHMRTDWANSRNGRAEYSGAANINATGGEFMLVAPFTGLFRGAAAEIATSTGSRVFWSGSQAAGEAATSFAQTNGATTLEMTATGQALTRATATAGWEATQGAWLAASRSFAEGAAGDVTVFQAATGVRVGGMWAVQEYPILIGNASVTGINYMIVYPNGAVVPLP